MQLLALYLDRLRRTDWAGELRTTIDLVVAADGGGATTKIGFFVPAGVAKPQSVKNFVVAAAYRGGETREQLEVATRALFAYFNEVIERGGDKLVIGGNETKIAINIFFVADLAMISKMVSGWRYERGNF